MTLRWHKGMTLGEFNAMIAQHRLEEAEARRRRLPLDDEVAEAICVHPYERLVTAIKGKRLEEALRITVEFSCGDCGQWLGHERRRLKL